MKKQINAYGILCIIALLVIAILECNTNNNPTTFLLRLLPPYHKKNGYFFYGNLIVLIITPIILSCLYKQVHCKMIDSIGKRLIWTFIFIIGCANIGEVGIQVVKSFQNDLDAIYMDRDNTQMTYSWETIEEDGQQYKVYSGEGYITLTNCSRKASQDFRIKLMIDNKNDIDVAPIIEQILNENEVITLAPGETRKINIFYLDELKSITEHYSSGGWRLDIDKVTLYNDEMSVDFIKEYT